jgi:multidrug efflux pump subunit AcrA (membrane-fusion protein)
MADGLLDLMNGTRSILTAAVALLAAGTTLAGCRSAKEPEQTPVVTVDVAPVLTAQIDRRVRASALIYPLQQAAIVPKITAPVKKVYVERGQNVRAGQVLIELESQDLAGAAREAQAAYELAEATYETTSKASVPEELQKAQLDAQSAKASLDAQQAVFDNRQALFKEGAIAQKDVNDAQVALSQAKTQYETAKKRLEDLQGFARDQALKAAVAQRDQAKARLDSAQAQLSYARITSPIDGVVTDRPAFQGETVASGMPVITVMDLSQVIARSHVSQAESAELKVGDAADLIAPGVAPVSGKVTQISPALDPAGTTVEVWVQAPNGDSRLKAGTSVQAEMVAKTVPDALVIPQAALLTSGSGSTSVIVVDPDNKPHKTAVTVGIRDAGKVQVTDGLESGQRVVTTGAFELAKLDAEVLKKTKVQIQPPKEEEEEEDDDAH